MSSSSSSPSEEQDDSFTRDVLGLKDTETEEQMDARIQADAKEMGVDVDLLVLSSIPPPPPLEKPHSTRTFSSATPRRSESIDSRSTGLTSHSSQQQQQQHLQGNGHDKRVSNTSLSFRDYENLRQASPPITPSHSSFSLPLSFSPPKKQFRRIRGLSILKRHRTGSNASAGCPHCAPGQQKEVHRLACGHMLCSQALRDLIGTGKKDAVPSCCGTPVPAHLVEQVLQREEQQGGLLEKLEQAAAMSEDGKPLDRPGSSSRKNSSESKVDSVARVQIHRDMSKFQHRQDFQLLKQEESDLHDRFLAWIERQRTDLQHKHERLRAEMKAAHESATEDLHERHAAAMAEAEDKQVKAEADMRETHSQERRDSATALKHMEAYCAGTYGNGEAHGRNVTAQDRAELEKARRARDAMDAKHESAINVLRGEQGRRMKLRAQRQEKEGQEMRRAQRREELEAERGWTAEVQGFEEGVGEKRGRMGVRWEMQTAILAKRVEREEVGVEWRDVDEKVQEVSRGVAVSG